MSRITVTLIIDVEVEMTADERYQLIHNAVDCIYGDAPDQVANIEIDNYDGGDNE